MKEMSLLTCPQANLMRAIQVKVPLPRCVKVTTVSAIVRGKKGVMKYMSHRKRSRDNVGEERRRGTREGNEKSVSMMYV